MSGIWISRTPNNERARVVARGIDIELWADKPTRLSAEDGGVWDAWDSIDDRGDSARIVLRRLVRGLGLRKGQCKLVKLVEVTNDQ